MSSLDRRLNPAAEMAKEYFSYLKGGQNWGDKKRTRDKWSFNFISDNFVDGVDCGVRKMFAGFFKTNSH